MKEAQERSSDNIESALANHSFFGRFDAAHLKSIRRCSCSLEYSDQSFIFREYGSADMLFLILEGKIAIGTYYNSEDYLIIQTLEPGEILGWSWFIPPHLWHFDAWALEKSKLLAISAEEVRSLCESDIHFGYTFYNRLSHMLAERLEMLQKRLKYLENERRRNLEESKKINYTESQIG